jgi:hypothetical protein
MIQHVHHDTKKEHTYKDDSGQNSWGIQSWCTSFKCLLLTSHLGSVNSVQFSLTCVHMVESCSNEGGRVPSVAWNCEYVTDYHCYYNLLIEEHITQIIISLYTTSKMFVVSVWTVFHTHFVDMAYLWCIATLVHRNAITPTPKLDFKELSHCCHSTNILPPPPPHTHTQSCIFFWKYITVHNSGLC